MSDKKEVGLNEVDIQAVIAAWIIANDGCGSSNGVDCYGEKGIFKGTVCQFYRRTGCIASGDAKVGEAKAWLEKYRQYKAEAAETEKQKGEAAKKQEQEAKKICKDCRYTFDSILVRIGKRDILPCKKKNSSVPAYLEGCPDFEPRNTACQSPSVSRNDVADAVAYAERIAQLEKDNARLAEEVSGYKERTRRALGLCEVIEMGINQDIKERKELQNQLNRHEEKVFQLEKGNARLKRRVRVYEERLRLAKELCAGGQCLVKKDRAELSDKCERLTEQRNGLSNSLIEQRNSLVEAMRRIKELESGDNILAQKIVDSVVRSNRLSDLCNEKDDLIDRLRNANSRSIGEMYRAEAELKDERRRRKEVEKENGALRSKLEQAAEDRKQLEEQLSESSDNHLYTVNLYAYKPTAEESLAMKGRCRQR